MTNSSDTCPACHASLPEGALFCVDCGERIESSDSGQEISSVETISGMETGPPHNLPTGRPKPPIPTFEVGDVIAEKYRVESLIGQGGMGVVYKVVELVSGETVALKIIGQKHVASEKATKRLIEEGMLTRGISHPNIVQVYDIGLHGEQPYIAMEYIEAQPLHIWRNTKLQTGETVSVEVVAKIITEVLDGLAVAHSAGIVHRCLLYTSPSPRDS